MQPFDEYTYIPAEYEGWIGNGYVSTIVRKSTVAEVVQAMNADDSEGVTATGVQELVLAEADLTDARKTDGSNTQFIAVTDLGSGNILVVQQHSQFVAATESYLQPLFAGRDIVAHSSLNSGERFVWWSDGRIVADFDPYHYNPEDDTAPVSVIDAARNIGGIGIDGPPDDNTGYPAVAGAFALADHLTEALVTPEVLSSNVFTVAVVRTGPGLLVEPPLVFESESSWGAVLDRYERSSRLCRQGRAVETRNDETAEVQFWFRPFGSYYLVDEQGPLYVIHRRRGYWFRVDGAMIKGAPPQGLKVRPDRLVDVHTNWDFEISTLLPLDVEGTPVEIGGRSGWQFDLPPGWQGLPGTVVFDTESGVALRWHTSYSTIELHDLDVGTPVADTLFTVE